MSSGDCSNPLHAQLEQENTRLQEENERLESDMKELQFELEQKNNTFAMDMPEFTRQQSNAEKADNHLRSVILELQNTIEGLEMQNSAAELSETEVISLRVRCSDLTSKIRELQNTIDGLEQQTLAAEDSAKEAIRLRLRLEEREKIEAELQAKIEQYEGKLENLQHYSDHERSRDQIDFLLKKIEELQASMEGLEAQNFAADTLSPETSDLRSRILEMNRKLSQFQDFRGVSEISEQFAQSHGIGGAIDYRLELQKQYEREKAFKQKIVELQNTIEGLELQAQGAEMVVLDAVSTHKKLRERNSVIGELQNIIGGLELQSRAAEETTKEKETLKKELRQRRNTEFNLNNKIVELENTIDGLEQQTRGAEEGMKLITDLRNRIKELETMLSKDHPQQEYLDELQSEMNDVRNAMRILKSENQDLLDEIDELRNRSDTESASSGMNAQDIRDLLTRINVLEQRQKEKELDWVVKEQRGRELIDSYAKRIKKLESEKANKNRTVERLEKHIQSLKGSIENDLVNLNVADDGRLSADGDSHLSVEIEVAHYRNESTYLRGECEALMEELEELKAHLETGDTWEPPAMILPQSQNVIRPTMTEAELSSIKSQIQRELENIRASTQLTTAPFLITGQPKQRAPTLDMRENNLPPDHPDFEDAEYDELEISPSLEKSVHFAPQTTEGDGTQNVAMARANTRTSWGQEELDKLRREMVLEMNTMVKREMREIMDAQSKQEYLHNPRKSEEAAVLEAASTLVSADTDLVSTLREELNKTRKKLEMTQVEIERMGKGADKFTAEYDSLQSKFESSRSECSNLQSQLTSKSEENERLMRNKIDLEDDVEQMHEKTRQFESQIRDMKERIETVVASKLRLVQTTSEEMETLRTVIKKLSSRITTR